ncbi:ribonuclease H-like domain-containing protein [Tanacetum coccineum]
MQDELLQFKLQKVWTLVELPNRKRAIGTKWVFRNKKDERGIVIKNKARLIAQGYTQEEGIDYMKLCGVPDDSSAFFMSIHKVKRPTLWTASSSPELGKKPCHLFVGLMGFQERKRYIKTLFAERQRSLNPKIPFDLVAYTDSDYAGASLDRKSTTRDLLIKAFDLLKEIVDFLNAHTIKYALTVNPTIYTSCIEQFWATIKAKTVNGEIQLQALVDGKKIIITESTVRRDLQLEDAEGVDCLPNATIFEQLTLMGYEKLSQKLTFYKSFFSPQWKFLIHTILQCLSAKTTAWNEFSSTMASAIICLATNQKFNFSKYIFESMVKNLENVSGKFLMYPRFVQVFLDQQLDDMSIHKRIYVASSHTKKVFANMRRVGKDFSGRVTPLFPTMMVQAQQEQGEDEAVYKELDDSLVRTATTAFSLEAEQDSGSDPRRQDTMGDTIAQTRFENVSKISNDSLLARVNTPRSDKDSMKLKELMEFCTKLQQRFLDLENTKTAQAQEIISLKLRVKKLEKKGGSRTHKLKRLYKGRKIDDIDKDAEIILVDETQGRYGDDLMFIVSDLAGKEVFVIEQGVPKSKKDNVAQVNTAVSTASIILVSAILITDVEITLAQGLAELKSAKPTTTTSTRSRAKGLVIYKQEQAPTPTVSSQQPSQAKIQDKGKAKMIEPEPVKKLSKKDQLKLDEEVAQRLQAEFDEQERIKREKAKANIALKETWDDIQAKIKADQLLAKRLQAREQEELTIKERAILFQQLLEKRRKHFAAKRA